MKSSIRNEIKAQIIRAGYTMQEVVDQLHDEYGWSDSVSNLSGKLQRESLRYREAVELADVLGYDLIWRGCEITTGAIREHRYDVLKKQADEKGLGEDVAFYLQFFRYGCPPHGGFGLGLDRLTMLFLGLSIKEVQFLFRGPNRLTP